jgi:hypothetical protein
MPGGRLKASALTEKINAALVKRFGPGKWFAHDGAGMYYLNTELIAAQKLDLAEVERVAAEAAASEEHIARVYTADDLMHGRVQHDAIGQAFTLSFQPQRSGDLFILQEPYYLFGGNPGSTTHGTPYDYDNHVPVIFMGSGIKAGSYARRIAVNDIAPTLAWILGTTEPSGSVGHILTELDR